MKDWRELFSLEGKVAVVCGGAGLIGRSICEVLCCAGARVIVLDQDSVLAGRNALKTTSPAGHNVHAMSVDITDEEQVAKAANDIWQDYGGCGILVNAAHYKDGEFFCSLDEYPLAAWRDVLDVNLTGAFLTCREFGRRMYRENGGVIVNISSTYGVVSADPRVYGDSGINSPVAYAATKSGLLNFTRYLAVHWRPKVRANVLIPGGVQHNQDPDFIEEYCQRTPLGRMAQPEDYQGALLFMCSDASSYMTGSAITVDGGWTAW